MLRRKVACSDWHLGWGYGGNDHLGMLEKIGEDEYLWTGHRQGRHGRILHSTYKITIKVIGDTYEIIGTTKNLFRLLPESKEVWKAIKELNE